MDEYRMVLENKGIMDTLEFTELTMYLHMGPPKPANRKI